MDNVRNIAAGRAGVGSSIVGAIVVIAILVALVYLIYYVLSDWRYTSASSPWLVKGTRIARKALRLPASLIPVSNDSRYGIEFTYSFWMYVNSWSTPNQLAGGSNLQHILHKGSSEANPQFQAPGIYMDQNSNRIVVKMNTFGNLNEECIVDNIPIGKWVYVTVVVINKNIDIYVNGNLKNRCTLTGIPMQNVGDMYITQNGGFDGMLGNVQYFNRALPYWKIEQLFNIGPPMTPCPESGVRPPYLASGFWLSDSKGQEVNN